MRTRGRLEAEATELDPVLFRQSVQCPREKGAAPPP